MTKWLIPLACFLVNLHQNTANVPFDCRLDGCVSGSCDTQEPYHCIEPGTQACPLAASTGTQDTYNYNCATTVPQAPSPVSRYCSQLAPPVVCDDEGTWGCSSEEGCVCKEGYYKNSHTTDCSLKRVRVVCSAGGVDLYFAPYNLTSFLENDGVAYLYDSDMGPSTAAPEWACTLTPNQDGELVMEYVYTQDNAGSLCGVMPDYESEEEMTLRAYVQYDRSMLTQSDLDLTITCRRPEDHATQEATVTVHQQTRSSEYVEVLGDSTNQVTMSVHVTGHVTSDETLTVVIEMPNQGREDFALLDLVAYNYPPIVSPPPEGNVEKQLVTNGCIPDSAGMHFDGFHKERVSPVNPPGGDITRLIYGLTAFTPRQAEGYTTEDDPPVPRGTVWLTVNVRTSKHPVNQILTRCDPDLDTNSVFTAEDKHLLTRWRRETDDQTVLTASGNVTIDTRTCYQRSGYYVPVLIMGIVTVVAVILAVYFWQRSTQATNTVLKQTAQEGNSNDTYRNEKKAVPSQEKAWYTSNHSLAQDFRKPSYKGSVADIPYYSESRTLPSNRPRHSIW